MSAPATVSALRSPHPRLCAGLSLVPGLGQLVTGQPGKALHYFLWTVVPLGASLALFVAAIGFGQGLISAGSVIWAMLLAICAIAVFLGLFVLGLFVWASAAVDAHRSAGEIRGGSPPSPERRYFHW
ncbi:MAG TPA: hypothetical protein VEK76_10530 [Candidatus Binatia bacterium]|nr:hypothetical protein [Candidatus Binatia bacterium]